MRPCRITCRALVSTRATVDCIRARTRSHLHCRTIRSHTPTGISNCVYIFLRTRQQNGRGLSAIGHCGRVRKEVGLPVPVPSERPVPQICIMRPRLSAQQIIICCSVFPSEATFHLVQRSDSHTVGESDRQSQLNKRARLMMTAAPVSDTVAAADEHERAPVCRQPRSAGKSRRTRVDSLATSVHRAPAR